jgi:hypothetical protein
MIGSSSQRDRNIEPLQPWQHLVEPECVIEREHAREPVFIGIEIIQTALQAGGVGRQAPKGGDHFAKLIRFRPILGIVDHQEFAAGELQRKIASFRFGLRM